MTQNTAIVWNPSKTTRDALEAALPEGAEVSWFETTEDDPGRGAAESALAAGAELILAAGGDGTIRAVAEYLAETAATADLGIVPLGTGNLLARNLGVPLNNISAAVTRAFENEATTIDIGWADVHLSDEVRRRAFAVMAGFGIDAHMITETNDDLKDRAGWLAYVESLGRALSASAVIDIRLSVDGEDAVEDKAHTLLVGNCGMLQGGIALLPDADPSDGALDLLVLQADGVAGWLDTARNMMWDHGIKRLFARDTASEDDSGSASTIRRRMTALTVDLAEPRMFEVDGDTVGEATRVEFSIQAAALRVR
ncbi:diacylglycerol/lipid kinase family protein [Microbacterium sp. ZW T5_56]|uniref:diacylglycerol/lipid kinase family protein n=1 Tax=Microbacterium sp. ZW T5_56 TaxID=3378081 RepID=UPI003852BED6